MLIKTTALTLLLIGTSVSAKSEKSDHGFDLSEVFDIFPKTSVKKQDSDFYSYSNRVYNYGNRGYDFVVDAIPSFLKTTKNQVASLEENKR